MPHLLHALVLLPALSLGAGSARAELPVEQDEDLRLLDLHVGLHLGAAATDGGFGTVSIVAGIYDFAVAGSGLGSPQSLMTGLYMLSLGTASLISAASSADGDLRAWRAARARFEAASAAERRLLRRQMAGRLQAAARNGAFGLAASGTFFGIGVALALATPSGLGALLVVDGAFALGVGIFRIAVDDQVARRWEQRDEDADSGYFTGCRVRPRITGASAGPGILPDGRGGVVPAASVMVRGVF